MDLSFIADEKARAVLENIRDRRSYPIAEMKGDRLSSQHMMMLSEAANWAPSHKHTEPWKLLWFVGESRGRLAKVLGDTYRQFIGDAFQQAKFEKIIARPQSVGAVLALVMHPAAKPKMPEWEEMAAVSCAAQNMHLAAQAMGIGFYWTTPGFMAHPQLRSFLALGERDRLMGLIYLGYPSGPWPHSVRRPVAQKIQLIES